MGSGYITGKYWLEKPGRWWKYNIKTYLKLDGRAWTGLIGYG
jgi:hypothetical protein